LPFARVFTRAGFDPIKIPFKVVGYETLINQRPVGGKTGALTAVSSTKTKTTEAKESPAKAGEWITLEVFAKGDSLSVQSGWRRGLRVRRRETAVRAERPHCLAPGRRSDHRDSQGRDQRAGHRTVTHKGRRFVAGRVVALTDMVQPFRGIP
jgi:hypothetical protein